MRLFGRSALSGTGLLWSGAALAAEPHGARGIAEPWEWWHQLPATPVMERVENFHWIVFWIMIGICALVFALMAYVLIRFNARRHPRPTGTSHNTLVEVTWTLVPVIILVVIAIPSFQLLYFADRTADPEMTLKVTGRQWYWEYEYPDQDGLSFSSLIIPAEELEPGQPRLLAVDNPVVLPVDTNIRILVTGGDVLHSWAVPAFGIKMDAVPGRLNETWARIEEEGVYYGQCSQLCGLNHAYMPIEVKAVSKERFGQWVEEAKARLAGHRASDGPSDRLASKDAAIAKGREE